jgi:hypothetical protein
MKLRHFLDAAYALLVEEYLRVGVNIMEAVEKTSEYRATSKPQEAVEVNEAARNQAALLKLQQMMAGV